MHRWTEKIFRLVDGETIVIDGLLLRCEGGGFRLPQPAGVVWQWERTAAGVLIRSTYQPVRCSGET